MALGQGGGAIRYLSEGRAQERQIETCLGDMSLGRISEDCRQICDACFVRSNFEALDHARLNIDPHSLAAWQDKPCRRDEQSPRPRADFQDFLSWPEFKTAEGDPSQPP